MDYKWFFEKVIFSYFFYIISWKEGTWVVQLILDNQL